MKHLYLKCLFIGILPLVSITVSAYDCNVDGLYYDLDETAKTARVTYLYFNSSSNKSAYSSSVNIPSNITYGQTIYSVTSIGGYAFNNCSDLTSVSIPNSVTSIGNNAFQGCSGLTSINIPNSVTSIGSSAFYECTGLTSINIPNSVTSIESSAFYNCIGLTSINIPNSVTSIGSTAFSGCTSLTSVTIPNSVTSIGYRAFDECTGLTSINIPNSVTSIESSAFSGCIGLTSINIPNSVTSIGSGAFYGTAWYNSQPDGLIYVNKIAYSYKGTMSENTRISIREGTTSISDQAFYDCSGLASITIPNSVTSIGDRAFSGCSGLTSVTIPNSVTSIGGWAFEWCVRLNSVIISSSFTSIGYEAFKFCSCFVFCNNETPPPASSSAFNEDMIAIVPDGSVTEYKKSKGWSKMKFNTPCFLSGTTQTTITLRTNDLFSNVKAVLNKVSYHPQNNFIKITDLKPNTKYSISLSGDYENIHLNYAMSVTTKDIILYVNTKTGPSSVQLTGSYSYDNDATITSFGFEGFPNQKKIKLIGLDPNKSYTQTFYVETKEGGKISKSVTYKTESLTLTTSQPKVISVGNVIVAAESNLDDEETNVGFEWRRTDWTSEFASKTGTAYLYNGTMEGYIRSLYTEKLWKYRPFYTSNAGNSYYGEWVGIDPTNTSYFEPTVHTYANVSVNDNSAEVKGYVQRGTDNVVSKGFAYWNQSQGMEAKEANSAAPSKISSVPSYAKTVEVSGSQQVMTASISDLEYETTYCYVAFVTTSDGETFYGDVCSFTTGADLLGIENVEVSSHEPAIEVARYNINGHRISSPQRGINIIRMSDGTTRKVVVK